MCVNLTDHKRQPARAPHGDVAVTEKAMLTGIKTVIPGQTFPQTELRTDFQFSSWFLFLFFTFAFYN